MDAADDDVEVEEVLLELTLVISKRSRARAVKSAAARSAGDGGDDDRVDASSGAGVTTAAACTACTASTCISSETSADGRVVAATPQVPAV